MRALLLLHVAREPSQFARFVMKPQSGLSSVAPADQLCELVYHGRAVTEELDYPVLLGLGVWGFGYVGPHDLQPTPEATVATRARFDFSRPYILPVTPEQGPSHDPVDTHSAESLSPEHRMPYFHF